MSEPDTDNLLQSRGFAEAVVRINKRAERQLDPTKLGGTRCQFIIIGGTQCQFIIIASLTTIR